VREINNPAVMKGQRLCTFLLNLTLFFGKVSSKRSL
jgi:hypothetical protein